MGTVTDKDLLTKLNGMRQKRAQSSIDPETIKKLNAMRTERAGNAAAPEAPEPGLIDKIWGGTSEDRLVPMDRAKDLGIGLANAGQGLYNTATQHVINPLFHKQIPKSQIDFGKKFGMENPSLLDSLIQGGAQYAPYALGAAAAAPEFAAGLLGQAATGAAYGATQSDDPLTGAGIGAGINAASHGLGAALQKLRPSQLFRGRLPIEEIQRNAQVAGDLPTPLGDIVGSPWLKKRYDNDLVSLPFSGVSGKGDIAADSIMNEGKAILGKLKGKVHHDDVTDVLASSLEKQSKLHEKQKNELYNNANRMADADGLELSLPAFSKKAEEYADAIKDSTMLKNEPSVKKLYERLQNYKNPVEEIKGEEKNFPRLEEAGHLKAKLNYFSDLYESHPDPEKRGLSGVFKNLSGALKEDIENEIEGSGNRALLNEWKNAEANYAKNYSPFLEKDVRQFTHGGKDTDLLVESFIKNNRRSDRGNLADKLASKLPEKDQNLLLYKYLSSALNKESGLNPAKLATAINNLGGNQFKAIVKDPAMQQRLLDYSRNVKLNGEAVDAMVNPKTGARGVGNLGAILSAISGLAGTSLGGAVGGLAGVALPGLAAKGATSYLTSPAVRESLIKAMMENKKPIYNSSKVNPFLQAGNPFIRGAPNQN